MAKVFNDQIVVSIDVGTTKISVLVAQVIDSRNFEIIGIGKCPSEGLRKGVVVDVQKTIASIRTAVKEAELMANVTIHSAAVGISGGHIHSTNSHGMVPIKQGSVQKSDIDSLMHAAKAIAIPEGMQILHVLPRFFIIDSREKVQNPLDMHGVRLEVQAHLIMGAIASVQNLIKCCQMAGVTVSDIILEQLASADAVLSPDEREIGVAMLDIGGGTSDLALYQNGNIVHTYVLPVAGNHFTNDLAVGLRTSLKEAEKIKKEYGSVNLNAQDCSLQIESVEGQQQQCIPLSVVNTILHARAQELLSLIHEEIIRNKLVSLMPAGLVLTGGGSLLNGIQALAETIFNVPVRIGNLRMGYPLPESLESPIYATGYGLLHQMLKQQNNLQTIPGPTIARILLRMKSWVIDFF